MDTKAETWCDRDENKLFEYCVDFNDWLDGEEAGSVREGTRWTAFRSLARPPIHAGYDSGCSAHANRLPRRAMKVAIAFVVCTMASIAHGQVYKCTDSTGKTTYSDVPCGSGSKPLKLPDEPNRSNTNPNVCAQLLDETQRLAAEAERNAKRGRTESSGSVNRRQALTKQYETRCVGITRSEPNPK